MVCYEIKYIINDPIYKSKYIKLMMKYRAQRYNSKNMRNGPKRDKSRIMSRNNMKIAQREMDEVEFNSNGHKNLLDVDRIMLERQMTSHNFNGDDESEYVGELTGEKINRSDIYDKGMPVRSTFTVKRSVYDNNSHLDFNLYEELKGSEKSNIEYDDNYSGDYAGLDESMKTITRGTDPYETCIIDLNSTTCWLHTNMFMLQKDDYIVNGIGLFNSFGALYMISGGNTEIEIKNYFGYQEKRHLNAGLLTIRDKLNVFRDQIIFDNYIINDKSIPSSTSMAIKIKKLIFNIIFNKSYINEEHKRINHIIKKISILDDNFNNVNSNDNYDNAYDNIDYVISVNTLSMIDIGIISIGRIRPIWHYKIDNIVTSRFKGFLMNFIRYVGKMFYYFEDSETQIIEIPMAKNIYSIGIVLSKTNSMMIPIDIKRMSSVINYLKPTILDEVIIPMIKKRFKLRLNKTLMKTGLEMAFMENELVGLYPEGGRLNECLQYTDIIFGKKSENKIINNKGYRTTRKFIANRSFEFYLRDIESNILLVMGRL